MEDKVDSDNGICHNKSREEVDELVNKYLALVYQGARRVARSSWVYEDDLVSEGMVVLWWLARWYDPRMGKPFGALVNKYVTMRMRRYVAREYARRPMYFSEVDGVVLETIMEGYERRRGHNVLVQTRRGVDYWVEWMGEILLREEMELLNGVYRDEVRVDEIARREGVSTRRVYYWLECSRRKVLGLVSCRGGVGDVGA